MQEEGFVAKLLYPAGAKDVLLGAPVAILVEEESDIAAFEDWTPEGAAAESSPAQSDAPQAQASSPAAGQKMVQQSGDRQFVSPLAKKTAMDKGVDL